MKPPFRIRKLGGLWTILTQAPALGWMIHSTHRTHDDAIRVVHRNWPWWP